MEHARANAIQMAARCPVPYFQLILQPDGMLSFEALGRIKVGSSVLTPGDFLDVLGTDTFLFQFDEAMLSLSVEQMLRWNRSSARPIGVHVNVSQETLAGSGYAHLVGESLSGLSIAERKLLSIEVTEPGSFWENQRVLAQLEHLRMLGVNVVIDDFPNWDKPEELIGWLGFNHRYGVTGIKIDRSLVRRVCDGDDEACFEFDGYVSKAHDYGLEVIAEGVESMDDVHIMTQAGVGLQGYALDRPQPAQRVTQTLDGSCFRQILRNGALHGSSSHEQSRFHA